MKRLPLPETLETERLLLRRPRLADAPVVLEAWGQDPEVTRYIGWETHRTVADSEAYLTAQEEAWSKGEGHRAWLIEERSAPHPVGAIGITFEGAGLRAWLGYVLARRCWGRGLMTEALVEVSRASFGLAPRLHRLWAVCDVENAASARVLEKAGYAFEGVLRAWALAPNLDAERPRDCRCYARLRDDPW
jgi:ribosomal-protein-alanine N-acetyltransferase